MENIISIPGSGEAFIKGPGVCLADRRNLVDSAFPHRIADDEVSAHLIPVQFLEHHVIVPDAGVTQRIGRGGVVDDLPLHLADPRPGRETETAGASRLHNPQLIAHGFHDLPPVLSREGIAIQAPGQVWGAPANTAAELRLGHLFSFEAGLDDFRYSQSDPSRADAAYYTISINKRQFSF